MAKGLCFRADCGGVMEVNESFSSMLCPHCSANNISAAAVRRFNKDVAKKGPSTPDPIMDAVNSQPSVPATTYADGNPKAVQGAKKFSLRFLPLPASVAVNQALEDGAKKYGAANWRQTGVAASVYVDACKRHLDAWYDGSQEVAIDSLIHNLGHSMACLAIIIDAQHNGKLIDDRPLPCVDIDALLQRLKP